MLIYACDMITDRSLIIFINDHDFTSNMYQRSVDHWSAVSGQDGDGSARWTEVERTERSFAQ